MPELTSSVSQAASSEVSLLVSRLSSFQSTCPSTRLPTFVVVLVGLVELNPPSRAADPTAQWVSTTSGSRSARW
jgi:hypothetical protein